MARIKFKYACPAGYGWTYHQKTAAIDRPLCEDGFTLNVDGLKQNIIDYIRNQLHVQNFRLIWFETIGKEA